MNAVIRLHGAALTMPPQLSEAIVCQWANQSPRPLSPCKSSPLWLHYCTSVTLLQYSWEISISYWPKIASVVSFHLLSGLCWRSDLLWDLQSIPQNASGCLDEKLAVVTGKHPFSVHLGIFNYSSIWTFNHFNVWETICRTTDGPGLPQQVHLHSFLYSGVESFYPH